VVKTAFHFAALAALASVAQADISPDIWVLPVRVHFENQPPRDVWISHFPYNHGNQPPVAEVFRRPIPGRKVLYMNKLGKGDSLIYSEKVYTTSDSMNYVIANAMAYRDIQFIEDISSDSLYPAGFWVDPWLNPAAGNRMLSQKPLFKDLIVVDPDDMTYTAEHVYNFDPGFTQKQVRQLYKKGGRENPTLKEAMKAGRLVMIQAVSVP
jgi:hypothetical protein